MFIGLSFAAPVGPMGILIIHRTLLRGRKIGLLSGAGIALADTTYAILAVFGLQLISPILNSIQMPIRLVGAALLIYIAFKTWRTSPATDPATEPDTAKSSSGVWALISAYGLTITNPMTILMFSSVFAAIGFLGVENQCLATEATIIGGVFSGSFLWWLVLITVVGGVRLRLNPVAFLWVNRLSALIIAYFAVRILIEMM